MQKKQKGMVGINVYSLGLYPFSNSAADKKAVQRFRDFFIGWYVTPVCWFMEMFVKYFHLSYDFVIIHKNLVPFPWTNNQYICYGNACQIGKNFYIPSFFCSRSSFFFFLFDMLGQLENKIEQIEVKLKYIAR